MHLYNLPPTFQSLCVCGDIHGEFNQLIYNIKRLSITDAVVVVAGDCGIGFDKEEYYRQLYNRISTTLEKRNVRLLLVRGNHDDPEYFDGQRLDFPRMTAVPDYSLVKWNERCILCVGGGISVDRMPRIRNMWFSKQRKENRPAVYWENEQVVFNETELEELKDNGILIDGVIAHTAPSFCFPTNKQGIEGWLLEDPTLEAELNTERETMDKLYSYLKINGHPLKDWFYGHFHASLNQYLEGVRFSLLDIQEIKSILSV